MTHIPVLTDEVIKLLDLQPNNNAVDCTLGDGGHARTMLARIAPRGKVLGIDWDQTAIAEIKDLRFKIKEFQRLVLVHGNFADLKKIVQKEKFGPIHGVLIDLGYSSSTLERGKGFSFENDEPLDMRYDTSSNLPTTAEVVNSAAVGELERMMREHGQEPQARLIAQAIVAVRKEKPIHTTKELTNLILDVYRAKLKSKKEVPWIGGLHPATRTFQALRIATNHELENLDAVLPQTVEILEPGGRVGVISFHSLEVARVKHFFKFNKSLIILTKKPLVASQEEIVRNPRSRSAKLRVAKKIE